MSVRAVVWLGVFGWVAGAWGCSDPGDGPMDGGGQLEDGGLPDGSIGGGDAGDIDPGALRITSLVAEDITRTSAAIHWTLSDFATGQVEWGPTVELGSFTVPEMSFDYDAHRQPITGLTPETTYYFRVRSVDADGNTAISDVESFTTSGGGSGTGDCGGSGVPVNFAAYGAVGDGVADDTAALQAAFDAESHLVADPGATFRISGRLDLDQAGDQVVDWNGATVTTTNSSLGLAFQIDKRGVGGSVCMQSLTVEGDRKIEDAFKLYSRTRMFDVDVQHLYRSSGFGNVIGWNIEITDDAAAHGDWVFDGCDCFDVDGGADSVHTDGNGVSRCVYLRFMSAVSAETNVVFANGTFDGAWGEEGDLIHYEDRSCGLGATSSGVYLDNMTLRNFSRRAAKLFGGGLQITGSSFEDPDPSNPRLATAWTPAGALTIGKFSSCSSLSTGTTVANNTFTYHGYEARFILTHHDENTYVQHNSFTEGADLRFSFTVGDVVITQNDFCAGECVIGDYIVSGQMNDVGTLFIDDSDAADVGTFSFFDYDVGSHPPTTLRPLP